MTIPYAALAAAALIRLNEGLRSMSPSGAYCWATRGASQLEIKRLTAVRHTDDSLALHQGARQTCPCRLVAMHQYPLGWVKTFVEERRHMGQDGGQEVGAVSAEVLAQLVFR